MHKLLIQVVGRPLAANCGIRVSLFFPVHLRNCLKIILI